MSIPCLEALLATVDFAVPADDDLVSRLLPAGECSALERVQQLARVLEVTRQLRQRAEEVLEGEMLRTQQLFENLVEPAHPLARQVFELAQQGLQQHWEALECLAEGEDSEQSLVLAQNADQTLARAQRLIERNEEVRPVFC